MKNGMLTRKTQKLARIWVIYACISLVIGLAVFYFAGLRPRRVTPILMYHSVSRETNTSLCVTPENFNRQMKFLTDNNYSVITIRELIESIRNGKQYLPRTVVITFDDGFEDNFTHVFPVLAKHGMPAAIFLITGYIGRKDGYLTWDQVRLMQKNGITFGGHTRNNVYLPLITDTAGIWGEIAGSREDIKKNTGTVADFFCYPTGGFNEEIKKVVRKAGYKAACTTNRGPGRSNRDIYALKRVKITNSDTRKPFHFRAKVSGFYNAFRKIKKSN